MSSIFEQGTLIPPTQPIDIAIHGHGGQVPNSQGGFVYSLTDLQKLNRFLLLGPLHVNAHWPTSTKEEIAKLIQGLIQAREGVEIIRLLRQISTGRKNLRQHPLLFALAVCATSDDLETKQGAYSILNSVCRTPTFLFIFVKYCEELGNIGVSPGTGWGRAGKRAVTKWYTKQSPKRLVRLLTKYKQRNGWSHRDLVRLAHVRPRNMDMTMKFIMRYIVKGLPKAKEEYDGRTECAAIIKLTQHLEDARRLNNVPEMCTYIRDYKLNWEHCPSHMLKRPEVWTTLLVTPGCLPSEAMLRQLGRMTKLGVFTDQETVNKVCERIIGMNEDAHNPLTEEEMEDDLEHRNMMHPFRICIAWMSYQSGRSKRIDWVPNVQIRDALMDAFYKSFTHVESTGKRHYLAIDLSLGMRDPAIGCSFLSCAKAAACMMMVTAKTEANTVIKAFSDQMVDLQIGQQDTLDEVLQKIDAVQFGACDASAPFKDAMENRMKDIDVFVIYTCNETWRGNCHPIEAFKNYRTFCGNPNVKLVVCAMASNDYSIGDTLDTQNTLNIAGLSPDVPSVIQQFVSDQLQ